MLAQTKSGCRAGSQGQRRKDRGQLPPEIVANKTLRVRNCGLAFQRVINQNHFGKFADDYSCEGAGKGSKQCEPRALCSTFVIGRCTRRQPSHPAATRVELLIHPIGAVSQRLVLKTCDYCFFRFLACRYTRGWTPWRFVLIAQNRIPRGLFFCSGCPGSGVYHVSWRSCTDSTRGCQSKCQIA